MRTRCLNTQLSLRACVYVRVVCRPRSKTAGNTRSSTRFARQGNPNYLSATRKRHDGACATDFQHSRPASNEKGHRPAKVEPYYPLTMHSKNFRGSSSEVQVTTHTFPEQVLLKTTHVHIYHPVHASLCIDGIGRSTSAPLWIAWCTLGEKAQLSRSAASRSLALTRSLLPTHGTATTWEESIKHRTYKYLGAEKSQTTVRCPFSVHVQGKHGTSATICLGEENKARSNVHCSFPLTPHCVESLTRKSKLPTRAQQNREVRNTIYSDHSARTL